MCIKKGTEICGYVRWRFLLESLKDLERQFAAFHIPFMCFYGEADQVIEELIGAWNVRVLSFEKDSEVIWHERDNRVKALCEKHSVQVIEKASHTLYDPEDIFNFNHDRIPNTCEAFRDNCYRMAMPEKPVPKPDLKFVADNLISSQSLYDPIKHKVHLNRQKYNIISLLFIMAIIRLKICLLHFFVGNFD